MGNFLEILYEVMVRPKATMRMIAAWRPLKQASVVCVASMAVSAAMLPMILPKFLGGLSGFLAGGYFFAGLFSWLLGAAVFNLAAECLGGQANGMGLLAALGFTYWPRLFLAPVWALAAFLPEGLRSWLLCMGGAAVTIWSVWLTVTAVRVAHGLSIRRAVLTLLAPVLLTGAVFALLLLAGAATLVLR